jgi:ATP-dependent Lon protease
VISMPEALPVLPLRDTVLFPLSVAPIVVSQERSLKLVSDVVAGRRLAVLVAQRVTDRRAAVPEDMYRIGTVAMIHELARAAEGSMRIAVQGLDRVRIHDYLQSEPYFIARAEQSADRVDAGFELDALTRAARSLFIELIGLAAEMSDELSTAVQAVTDPRQLAYVIAAGTPLALELRQEILETDPVSAKLRRLIEVLQRELAARQLIQKITNDTSAEMSKAQRDHVLRKHMEAIQRELGEADPERADSRDLRERLRKAALSPEARKEAEGELDRLERVPTISPEHGIIRTYLDWMSKLPWNVTTGAPVEIGRARAVLDEDHYDLQKVKDRIIEYLAVKSLREQRRDEVAPDGAPSEQRPAGEPILCFVGPPGVGKTSLGQSIARAMSRKFFRVSLGGIHDEAEIRGHRRTYIGAMPGKIIQALARAETADPVFMLDEVDKLGVGFHGDPSAALLEVLDPAQNHTFVDTYLGVPFDLSRVLFICTANTTATVPQALLDRMEVIGLAGYTDAEKLDIARRYLLPKQRAAHGLRESEVLVDDGALRTAIRAYTREAGVRGIERELATVLRKATRRIVEGASAPIVVRAPDVAEYLGPPRFYDEVAERIDRPGVATGLSWTPVGGEILFVEASLMPGDEEQLILTGMLGNVMRESAQAALSYLRSNAERFGIDPQALQRKVVHVHVPVGAIPKDGPSAGVTILVAIASHASGRAVRSDLAMTGEITLRGKVLPIGGVKEKVLAAHRAGIRTIILPRRNEGALDEVPEEVRKITEILFIESADDLLGIALGVGPMAKQHAEPNQAPPPVH